MVEKGDAIVLRENEGQALTTTGDLDIGSMRKRLKDMRDFLKRDMKEGRDYGKPFSSAGKKVLLKPGAEKLINLFRFAPHVECIDKPTLEQIKAGDISYSYRATLTHSETGRNAGQCEGSCNVWERKYQSQIIPLCSNCSRPMLEEGETKWYSCVACRLKKTKAEPQDFDNTCRKIAIKRALVGAVIQATAAADEFTADLETKEERDTHGVADASPSPAAPVKTPPAASEPRDPDEPPERGEPTPPAGPGPRSSVFCPICKGDTKFKKGTSKKGNPYALYECLKKCKDGVVWAEMDGSVKM